MQPVFFLVGLLVTQGDGFMSVANVSEIMRAFVIPPSNNLFNVGFEIPETDEAWKTVETSGLILAEAANLLILPERSQGRAAWVQAAREMSEASQRALAAARAQNGDEEEWFTLTEEILAACSSCHDQFWIVN